MYPCYGLESGSGCRSQLDTIAKISSSIPFLGHKMITADKDWWSEKQWENIPVTRKPKTVE
ncbi:hypothetical protein K7432_012560 [Basidiobolus ranarum]|uniref:Uncharacterized protein n=1 Tax=Basidiobolus ranarum TaxID=34480 RepID=A0ABR2WKK0_9FUNG